MPTFVSSHLARRPAAFLTAVFAVSMGVACEGSVVDPEPDAGALGPEAMPEPTPAVDGGENPNQDGGDAGREPDSDAGPVEDAGPVLDAGPDSEGWVTAPSLPQPRQETAVVAVGDDVYVIGGYDAPPGQTMQTSVYVLNVPTLTWRTAAPFPAPAHHIQAAVVDNKIFALGSLRASFVENGDCFVYDPGSDSWSPLAAMPANVARGAGVALADAGIIYVIGGYRAFSASAAVSAYDVANDEWSARAPLPSALDHLVGANVDGVLVVAGGRAVSIGAHQANTYIYAPGLDEWNEVAAMPTSRGGGAAAALDGQLVVIGGEGALVVGGVFAEVEAYDVAGDVWRSLPPMVRPRHGMGAATVGDQIVVPGGADVQAFAAVRDVSLFRFSSP